MSVLITRINLDYFTEINWIKMNKLELNWIIRNQQLNTNKWNEKLELQTFKCNRYAEEIYKGTNVFFLLMFLWYPIRWLQFFLF